MLGCLFQKFRQIKAGAAVVYGWCSALLLIDLKYIYIYIWAIFTRELSASYGISVLGQNGSGQNVIGQNGTNKMVSIKSSINLST